MRYRLRVVELQAIARDLDEICRRKRAEPEFDRRVRGIHRDHAVDVELVVVDVRRKRADRGRPDAVVAFRHRVWLAIDLADDADLFRIRRPEAQRHRAIRVHLRRDDGGRTRTAATGLRRTARSRAGRRGRRLRQARSRETDDTHQNDTCISKHSSGPLFEELTMFESSLIPSNQFPVASSYQSAVPAH